MKEASNPNTAEAAYLKGLGEKDPLSSDEFVTSCDCGGLVLVSDRFDDGRAPCSHEDTH